MRHAVLRHVDGQVPPLGVCGICERPKPDLLERGFGLRICLDCRRSERARYEAATGRCARGCEYDLAYHTSVDRCPTEDEARRMAGDR
jgi:hypothetical protein